jgi:hypothetical protein
MTNAATRAAPHRAGPTMTTAELSRLARARDPACIPHLVELLTLAALDLLRLEARAEALIAQAHSTSPEAPRQRLTAHRALQRLRHRPAGREPRPSRHRHVARRS